LIPDKWKRHEMHALEKIKQNYFRTRSSASKGSTTKFPADMIKLIGKLQVTNHNSTPEDLYHGYVQRENFC
jgi:hypothetical protein